MSDQCREIQGVAQASAAAFGQAGLATHRRARSVLARGQTRKSGQLWGASEDVNVADFGQQLEGGDIANAGNRGEQVTLLP